MLSHLQPDLATSRDLVQKLLLLMEKETSEGVLSTISEVAPKHLAYLLKDEDGSAVDQSLTAPILKDMSSTKLGSRRAVTMIVGQVFWQISQETIAWSTSASNLFQVLQPALEKIVSEASTISAATTVGVAEAWIALTILLCACHKSKFGELFNSLHIPN